MKLRTIFALSCALLVSGRTSQASLIAGWTFEGTSVGSPNGADKSYGVADAGDNTFGSLASGHHASSATVWSSPAGNGSVKSFSSDHWATGDYYQFQVNSIGYSGITVKWDQTGSGTGPRDFVLQYSTDGSGFTTVGSAYKVLINGAPNSAWSLGAGVQIAYGFSFSLPSLAENQGTLFLRLVDNSTTSINNATVGTGGTDRVDNFMISGVAVPEPSTFIAGALLALPFGVQGVRYLRNRKQA